MYSTRRRRAAAVTGVLTAAVLALQSAGLVRAQESVSYGHRDEPALGPVAVNPATASLRLPLDSVTDSAEERRLSAVAQNRLVTQCMARYGVTYARQDPAPVTGTEDRHAYLFGVADPAFAAAHGYDQTAATPPPPRPAEPELNEDGLTALSGERPGDAPTGLPPRTEEEAQEMDSGITVNGQTVPVGGCASEGYRKLYAPTRASIDYMFSFELAHEAHVRTEEDSRMSRVFREWSQCMARSGYPGIANPYLVLDKLGLGAEPGGAEAIAAAVQDVACKQEVNLVGIGAAVETAYQSQVVAEVAEQHALYSTQRATRLALAASLV